MILRSLPAPIAQLVCLSSCLRVIVIALISWVEIISERERPQMFNHVPEFPRAR
jgi:hypothetical protein